jgi:2-keto-4-pentenoate hydratase/2-oxohepta-3-ene-1,7-dioic acid hydratase in catechol pathway
VIVPGGWTTASCSADAAERRGGAEAGHLDLIFDCPSIVSFVSRFVTLMPGDLIYTGTPGQTRKMKPGDVVEVDIEGIGVLKNHVA